jgi:hypothetical protein
MRALWPIERAVLKAAAHDYPHSSECLNRQMESAQVSDFENTGAGFFSTITVDAVAPSLSDKSPLDAATGTIAGIKLGMGFLVFLENGRVSLIEGYSYGDESTVGIDFENVIFDLKPWSTAGLD